MKLTRRQQTFILSSVLLMFAAAQSQSCSSPDDVAPQRDVDAATGGTGLPDGTTGMGGGAIAPGWGGSGGSGGSGGLGWGGSGGSGATGGLGPVGGSGGADIPDASVGGAGTGGTAGTGAAGGTGASGGVGATGGTGATGGMAATGGTAATSGTGATGGTGVPDASLTPPNPDETTVAVVRSPVLSAAAIDQTEITRMVREAVQLAGGLDDVIAAGDVVVLKPNMVGDHDFTSDQIPWAGDVLAQQVNGVTTDYRVARAVVELVREQSPSAIYVMEGSASDTPTVMNTLGYVPANFTGVSAVDQFIAIEDDSGGWQETSSPLLVSVNVPNGILSNQYYYNARYYNADVVISLPTLKTHWHAVVTGGVKNLGIGATPVSIYGSRSGSTDRMLRPTGNPLAPDHGSVGLHHFIHDYYAGRPADFVIMDGLQGIQNGPTPCYEYTGKTQLSDDQMNMRLILAGRDGVAVDTIESLIIQWDPLSVEYLQRLDQNGVGTINTANIRVVGSRVDQVRTPFEGVTSELSSGGSTVSDVTPPPLNIQNPSSVAGLLMMSITDDPDLRKVEIYVGGVLIEPPVISQFDQITLDVSSLGPGTYDLTVLAYDYYLNVQQQTLPGAVVVQ